MTSRLFSLKNLLPVIVMTVLVGCSTNGAQVTRSIPDYDQKPDKGETTTFGLDYRDFDYAASKAVEEFLANPLSQKPGSNAPWVLAISRVVNDTPLTLDTDRLIKKIRIALLKSGRFVVTTAVGSKRESMVAEVRELENSDLFNQKTVAKKGTVVAPELALSGVIDQGVNTIGSQQQADYYFRLTITNLQTGLAYWETETVISKLGDNDSFTWQ